MLDSSDITKLLKLEYANNLLYISSLLLLKGVQFVLQIATTGPKPNYWAPAIVMAGMLGFLFAAAFECKRPFWKLRGNRCVDQTAFWLAFGSYDVVTDIYSIVVVMWVTSKLNLQRQNRIKLLVILGSRFLPAVCAIARLPFLHSAYTSSNYTIELFKLGMPTQLQLHVAVVTLSLGKIFRFLEFLNVGYLSSSIEPTEGKGTMNHSRGRKYGYNSKVSNNSSHHHHTKKASISDRDSTKELVPREYGHTTTQVEGALPMRKMNCAADRHQGQDRNQIGVAQSDLQPAGNEIMVTRLYEIRSESAAKDESRYDDVDAEMQHS